MKINKGNAGYIQSRKKKVIAKCIIEFGIVIALFVLGIVQTKSRLNMLTVVAILGCLPASKALVEVIMIFPHKTIATEKVQEIEKSGTLLTKIFDLVFTSEKKIMPVECIVIQKHTVCGYSVKTKISTQDIEQHLKQYLSANGVTGATVKIFQEYGAFLKRVHELNTLAENDKENEQGINDKIQNILLSLSI